jgi:prepilin-type N-terminal cleavage/methylation domain-containing protein
MKHGDDRNKHGFTLIEIVIAMTILSIVVTILAGVFVTNADIFASIVRSNDEISDLRLASARLAIEIRSIKDERSIHQATDSSLRFQNDDGEQIRLDFEPRQNELLLNSRTLASNIGTCRFTYYDVRGRKLVKPKVSPKTNIWSVEVELAVSGNGSARVVSRVYPRNLI